MLKWLKRLFSKKQLAAEPSRTDTEFTAEIVQITQLSKHPNADKLEIARFSMKGIGETTYEVVVQKNTFHVGAFAAYFSIDCLLPTAHADFAFLKDRLDGKGKDVFRLKAARIRKVFSQGLLVQLGTVIEQRSLDYGQQVAELWGVTYHKDPEPVGPSSSTQKKPKAQAAPVYGVDSLKKVPNLFGPNEPVFITEKIHGTNFRFGWIRRRFLGLPIGWRFFVGSHRTERSGSGSTSWYGDDLYALAATKMGLAKLTRFDKGMVFYGELYGYTYDGKAIQPGWTYNRHVDAGPGLVIFDIRDQSEGCWLGPFERFDMVENLGMQHVPVLHVVGDPADVKDKWEGQSSTLDPGTIMEGVVAENIAGLRRKAKYVHQAYLEAK